MAVGDRRQGGTNGLVDVASRGEVSPDLHEADSLPDHIGELLLRKRTVLDGGGGQVQDRVA